MQLLAGQADVDDDVVAVQLGAAERGVHDECGAVQFLRRSEDLAGETWAIVMWSRTVMLNISSLSLGVDHQVAQG